MYSKQYLLSYWEQELACLKSVRKEVFATLLSNLLRSFFCNATTSASMRCKTLQDVLNFEVDKLRKYLVIARVVILT